MAHRLHGPTIEVALHPVREGVWSVMRGGVVLVASSIQPEHDACRALLAQGITGTLVTRHAGEAHQSLAMGIAWGARFRGAPPDFQALSPEEFTEAMSRLSACPAPASLEA